MEQKYVLTNKTRILAHGRIAHRIRAVRGIIVDGKKIVGEGELGGWVECTGNLSHDGEAWVHGAAWVCHNARVYGNAQVCGVTCIGDDDN